MSICTRALSCHARSLSAWVFCSSRRMRTAVGMSSGLTAARSTCSAGALGATSGMPPLGEPCDAAPPVEPDAAPVAEPEAPAAEPLAPAEAPALALAPAVAAGFFLSIGLSFGPATAVAVTRNEDNTTTVEGTRMRILQPARAGDRRP
ncbi:MAG TPA: hypothetical protein VFP84_30380 [Kofleriaceae bacterium]|nr:hypothetical protein [Kofleriaceae bacterium]